MYPEAHALHVYLSPSQLTQLEFQSQLTHLPEISPYPEAHALHYVVYVGHEMQYGSKHEAVEGYYLEDLRRENRDVLEL